MDLFKLKNLPDFLDDFCKPPLKPLTYLSSQCVLQYFDVHTRFHLSNACPSLRHQHATAPLRIRYLKFTETGYHLDDFEHIFHLKKRHNVYFVCHSIRVGDLGYDVHEFKVGVTINDAIRRHLKTFILGKRAPIIGKLEIDEHSKMAIDPILESQILKTALNLYIESHDYFSNPQWIEKLLNFPHKTIETSPFHFLNLVQIARGWLEKPREVGARFTVRNHWLDLLPISANIAQQTGIRALTRYYKNLDCLTYRLHGNKELNIYAYESPKLSRPDGPERLPLQQVKPDVLREKMRDQRREMSQKEQTGNFCHQPWVLVMEVMEAGSAKVY